MNVVIYNYYCTRLRVDLVEYNYMMMTRILNERLLLSRNV